MLGISVYPNKSSVQECIQYIDKATKLGYQRLFTSLLELEPGRTDQVLKDFKEVLAFAKERQMWISLDINPGLFNTLGVTYDDLTFFKDLGADIVRLDMNFDGMPESIMTYDQSGMYVEVNISNNTENIANTFSYQPLRRKIIGCHNFYPQPFTGLDTEYFLETTRKYKEMGLRTAAFISSNVGTVGPHAYNDGLPSLEIHRHIDLQAQAQYLINTKLIDDILIGNAFASDEELAAVAKLNQDIPQFVIEFLPGTTKLEKEVILDNLHFNRGDINSYSIRSTFVKLKYKSADMPVNNALPALERGMITIGNNDFGQYKAEVNIVKQAMPNKEGYKNVVAKIVPSNVDFINFIKPWDKFEFIDQAEN